MPSNIPSDSQDTASPPSPYYGDDWGGGPSRRKDRPPRTLKTKQQAQAQWLALGLVTVAVVMALTLLPRESAGVLFWGAVSLLIGGAVGIKGVQNFHAIRASVRRDIRRVRTGYREHRVRVGFWLALLATGLMVLAGNRFSPGATDSQLEAGLVYLALGLAAVGVIPRATVRVWEHTRTQLRDQSNWLLFGVGVLILWVVAEANGRLLKVGLLSDVPHDDQFVFLCAGVVLVVAGLGGVQWLKALRIKRGVAWEWVAVTVIVLLGFGIRLWQLGSAVHRFVDEMNFATVVLYFETGDNIMLLHPVIRGYPALFAYWQHWGMGTFGRDLYTLRIVSVVLGTLTIPAVYLLGREIVDRRTGLMAAALLAGFPPHIQHSRLGIGIIADPLFGTLALAFMARAIKTRKRRDYALSGVCLGLTQYFYEAGRLLYPPLMVVWVVIGLILWTPKPSKRGLMITLLAAVVVAGPIYYTLAGIHAPLMARMEESGWVAASDTLPESESSREAYISRLKTTFRVYTNLPESLLYYYGGDHAFLLAVLIPFFLLGGAYALWRFRNPAFLLVIWVVSTSVGNSLIKDVTISARYVVVFPALALLVALGIRETAALVWPKKLPAYTQAIVLTGLIVGLCIYQVDFYMGPQLTRYNEQIRNKQKDGEDALFRARELPVGTQVFIVGEDIIDYGYAQSIMNYLRPGMNVELFARDQMTMLYLETMPERENLVFFLMPEDTRTFDRLRRFFTLLPPEKSPYNVPEDQQFLMYFAPAYLQQHDNPPVIGIEPQP